MALVSETNKAKHSPPKKHSCATSRKDKEAVRHVTSSLRSDERSRLANQIQLSNSGDRFAHHSQFPDYLAGVSTRATEFSRNSPQNNVQNV